MLHNAKVCLLLLFINRQAPSHASKHINIKEPDIDVYFISQGCLPKVVAFHVIFQIELNVLILELMLRCYFINTAFWDCNGYLHEHSVNSGFHAATNGSH